VLAALSLAGSVLLSSSANGIAVFMLFGAGLTAGLLGQIGEALGSRTLDRVADVVSWALPFEALYQAALSAITADTVGFTRLAIDLGPFGGAERAGPLLWPWVLAYLALLGLAASAAFARRDL
jgi:Cu-processing system permease protein